MNTELSEFDRDSGTSNGGDRDPPPPPKRGGALAALALLVALAALAGTAWMWWQDRADAGQDRQRAMQEIVRLDASDDALELRLQQLRERIDSLEAAESGSELEAVQQRLQADRGRLAEIERSIEEQLALSRSLQGATDAMHARLLAAESGLARIAGPALDAGSELDLAEVDYLLRLANERLELFADVAAADQALALADAQLDAIDNPAYLGVRREIAAARAALSRVEMADPLEVAAELDSVQERIPSLEFQDARSAAESAGGPAESGWWARLKNTLAGLVTIRRSAGDDVTLSLEDKDYVRQRLWLQLEMAHLALVRRDQAGFRDALARARQTLERWFADTSAEVQAADRALDELAALAIQSELPDITGPWNSLRLLRSAGRAPAPSGTTVAPAVPVSEPDARSEPAADSDTKPDTESVVDAEAGSGDQNR